MSDDEQEVPPDQDLEEDYDDECIFPQFSEEELTANRAHAILREAFLKEGDYPPKVHRAAVEYLEWYFSRLTKEASEAQ